METLLTVEKMSGKKPSELIEMESLLKPFPYELEYLWMAFTKLSRNRSVGMQSNPITFREMLDYCDLYRTKLTGIEIEVIETLDKLFLTEKGNNEQHN